MHRRRLRILLIFRAPVGGLFRHVHDLARGLSGLGHEVGIVCDSLTGGEAAESRLAEAEAYCGLGVHRLPMHRMPGLGDLAAARAVRRHCAGLSPDILHGHGAKGGAYARLAARGLGARAFYTPHGGSLHFEWKSAQGAVFLTTERLLLPRTDGFLFVCEFERQAFAAKLGLGKVPSLVAHNGLWPEEFSEVPIGSRASDVLFIGELRDLKGVDVLLDALGHLDRSGRPVTATIVGGGAMRADYEAQAARLGLASKVNFAGPLPARQAFALGRLFVVPSRAESFPYVILEAVAAGKAVIASDVGGIGEMLPAANLVPAGDPQALAQAIRAGLDDLDSLRSAELRSTFRARFSASAMAEAVRDFYAKILAGKEATTDQIGAAR
ncbi:MAG: glycosyltransferase family 4 protein [Parvibaculaceae bacterium]